GCFRAIRLHVRNADMEVLDLKVVYANGQPDDIPVRTFIRQGERTRPMDLRGWERAIDRVEMVYRSVPNVRRGHRVRGRAEPGAGAGRRQGTSRVLDGRPTARGLPRSSIPWLFSGRPAVLSKANGSPMSK